MDLSHLQKQVRFHSRASAVTITLRSMGILAKLCHAHVHLYCSGGHTPRCLPCIFGDPLTKQRENPPYLPRRLAVFQVLMYST